MRIAYDRAGDILVVDLGPLSEGPGAEELAPGVYLDRTEAGKVLALEIVGASRFYPRAQLEQLGPSAAGPRSVLEAAAIAGVAATSLRRAIREGRLPAEKVGGEWLIADADLDAFRAKGAKRGRPVGAGRMMFPGGAEHPTPEELADELGIPGVRVRDWLRAKYPERPGRGEIEWRILPDDERAIRAEVPATVGRRKTGAIAERSATSTTAKRGRAKA